MRNFMLFTMSLCIVLLISACSQNQESKGRTSTDVVQWKALSELDELAEHLESDVKDNDLEHVREHIADLQAAAKEVIENPPPKNSKNPEKIKLIQADLKSLIDNITDELVSNDQMLTSLVMSLHPIVESMMEAAGVPHVHDHEDHEGHEHDDNHNE